MSANPATRVRYSSGQGKDTIHCRYGYFGTIQRLRLRQPNLRAETLGLADNQIYYVGDLAGIGTIEWGSTGAIFKYMCIF
jgi:hypothetical protein